MSKKILIIEDDSLIRGLYTRSLKNSGYEVTEAEDGEKGYQLMHKGGYDLVLLDIMLPSLNGVDILNKLKTTPPLSPNKKILILTNLDDNVVKKDSEFYGADGYLVKNQIDIIKFPDLIKKYL